MIRYRTSATPRDIAALPKLLDGLEESYPAFDRWLRDKAIPSLATAEGRIVMAEDGDEIVGVCLGKRSADETKIRCIRVAPRWRRNGIGLALVERMMAALDCADPLVTVPEPLVHDYARMFVNEFRYDLTRVERGLYAEGKLEYVFNGQRDAILAARTPDALAEAKPG